MSRFLGDPEAFELGHTMRACTKGIWMSTSVLECGDYCILLLDTEGIDSVNDQASNDAKILVSTLLLSSYFIYNSMGVPRNNDLQKMRLAFTSQLLNSMVPVVMLQCVCAKCIWYSQFVSLYLLKLLSLKVQQKLSTG